MSQEQGAIRFCCGCTLQRKLDYGYRPRFDGGEQVCPEHGEGVHGRRSFDGLVKRRMAAMRAPRND